MLKYQEEKHLVQKLWQQNISSCDIQLWLLAGFFQHTAFLTSDYLISWKDGAKNVTEILFVVCFSELRENSHLRLRQLVLRDTGEAAVVCQKTSLNQLFVTASLLYPGLSLEATALDGLLKKLKTQRIHNSISVAKEDTPNSTKPQLTVYNGNTWKDRTSLFLTSHHKQRSLLFSTNVVVQMWPCVYLSGPQTAFLNPILCYLCWNRV